MSDLAVTPLYDLHLELGAKMVPFAGYSMPVQYPLGVMKEHLHCRADAGLFDVSHMGQVWVDGPDWDAVALGFERLVPQNVLGLADGRQRYGFFTNDAGGIEDDLMFARRGERLFVVVNAACKAEDIARMIQALGPSLTVTPVEDRALIAVQGPAAEAVLAAQVPDISTMKFMDVRNCTVDGVELWISRSGYTGEDGFEISIPEAEAERVCRALLEDPRVQPIGLGARDSLRLEAGLCLYGHDIDAGTSPVDAQLTWAIQAVRKTGGARAGGFPGAAAILDQLAHGSDRKRVGLLPQGRAPMREAVPLFDSETATDPVGIVTSGGFGPTVQAPVAMGYVPTNLSAPDTELWGEVRGKRLPVRVASLPFVPANFKR
ncbi:glycine cleavage system aminomethyltransferase GcvT [Aliishimia ponticola]|uniref:aminomethyltransferase n=1 Tax=Aliishimia ponticola TaxID=2499833 RepID=A0A4V3XK16_9RHOB|nr:glycine cleavage system aminomethyltransferase GcvT [Aliishimia ponticola]THH35223.1 glycine cleavage system aminomethyltransferase GcvT [Aliishimia ponticola]